MDLRPLSSNASSSQSSSQQVVTSLRGGWLIGARVAFWVLAALVLLLFAVSLPTYLAYLQTVCVDTPCPSQQLTLTSLHALLILGISLKGYAVLTLTLTLVPALTWVAMGGVLAWRRSNDWLALLVAFMLVVGGATNALYNGFTVSQAGWTLPANLLGFLYSSTLFLVFALFPSGHFAPRWIGWLLPAFLLNNFLYQLFPDWYAHLPGWVQFAGLLDFAGSLLLLLFAQVYRYRRLSSAIQRQQTKWVLFSILLGITSTLIWLALERLIPSLNGSLYDLANSYLNDLGSLLLPISFAIAITRYRLWDIDILINRTLVYGSLSACVIGLYVFVVAYLGALFRTDNNLAISLLATALVAVLFQPLRGWLQRGVNRLMYGQRDEPYTVVARLGQRLQETPAPDAILSSIVETVREALKLSYTAIEVKEGSAFVLAASCGIPPNKVALRLPLLHQKEVVGALLIAPRGRDEALTPADVRLLNDLADQIGIAVHTVRLTADLQRMATDLQSSRERLVLAREDERRRLRRDLHDGLGPTLAALALSASTVSDLIPSDPNAAVALANSLQQEIRATVKDVRRLVYDLRPPALDELGLFGAIRERAAQLSSTHEKSNDQSSRGLLVHVEAPHNPPPLPAAVEVAAYRIVQEALTNVTRHAGAYTCTVRLWLTDALEIEVIDDGVGLPNEHQPGVGLLSMRERAEELGGFCTVEQRAVTGGTRVHARLPLGKE